MKRNSFFYVPHLFFAVYLLGSFFSCRKYAGDCEAIITVKMKDTTLQTNNMIPVADAKLELSYEGSNPYSNRPEVQITDSAGKAYMIYKDRETIHIRITKGNLKAPPFTIKVTPGKIVKETAEIQ